MLGQLNTIKKQKTICQCKYRKPIKIGTITLNLGL